MSTRIPPIGFRAMPFWFRGQLSENAATCLTLKVENCVKHQIRMKRKPQDSDPNEFSKRAVKRIAQQLTSAIKDAPPRLSLREAESLTGIPRGTMGGWLHSDDVDRLRFFLLKLALLSSDERSSLMDRFYPQFPTPAHEFFDRDPLFRDQLARLGEKRAGTTVITGGTLYWSSFVATSLVNASADVEKCLGIDACMAYDLAAADVGYRCSCIVPVPGVHYIQPEVSESEFKRCFLEAWRQIAHHTRGLRAPIKRPVQRFLFNGVWSVLASSRAEIASFGRTAHVILGADAHSDPILTDLARPIHIVQILNVPSMKRDSVGNLRLRISEFRG